MAKQRPKIVHPTNRVWPGMPHCPMDTAEQSYAKGYRTGLNWKDTYRPGGPFWSSSRDGRFIALYNHQKLVHDEWLRGFDVGFKEQKSKMPSSPGLTPCP